MTTLRIVTAKARQVKTTVSDVIAELTFALVVFGAGFLVGAAMAIGRGWTL
jgi:hypothetical protein